MFKLYLHGVFVSIQMKRILSTPLHSTVKVYSIWSYQSDYLSFSVRAKNQTFLAFLILQLFVLVTAHLGGSIENTELSMRDNSVEVRLRLFYGAMSGVQRCRGYIGCCMPRVWACTVILSIVHKYITDYCK